MHSCWQRLFHVDLYLRLQLVQLGLRSLVNSLQLLFLLIKSFSVRSLPFEVFFIYLHLGNSNSLLPLASLSLKPLKWCRRRVLVSSEASLSPFHDYCFVTGSVWRIGLCLYLSLCSEWHFSTFSSLSMYQEFRSKIIVWKNSPHPLFCCIFDDPHPSY